MTVEELINRLRQFDPKDEVMVESYMNMLPEHGGGSDVSKIAIVEMEDRWVYIKCADSDDPKFQS